MGGGFSRQSLVDHAANYTFRPLRRKSNKSIVTSSNENNDRGGVNMDSISSPRRSTSKDQTASTMDIQMSSPRRSTSKDHDVLITDCISSPRRSTSKDHDVLITDCISSPRRSTSNDRVTTDCTPSAKLLENNNESGKKGHTQSLNSPDRTPQTISSPPRTISSPTITTPTAEIISKKETKESVNIINSDINIPQKKDQDEKDCLGKVIIPSHEESDDEYGRRLSDYDGWVGSPSFREYCVNDFLKPDSNTCDGEMIETKTKGVNGKEDLTPMSTKKWRRIRKIKKVISMGNPSGMKNLLNVSACYSPANSAPHQKLVNQIEKNG